jgi:hypothetical protein
MDKEELGATPAAVPPEGEPKAKATATEPETKVETTGEADVAKLQEENARIAKALKEANKESAERRKRLEELEAIETKRKEAEMTEAEKTQARIKQLEAEKAERENEVLQFKRKELQRKVAQSIGLPEALAYRLMGEDEEAMTEDAKTILAVLPQKTTEEVPPKAPTLKATNPGNGEKGETDAMKKARLLGKQVNAWDSDWAKQHGGGSFIIDKGDAS